MWWYQKRINLPKILWGVNIHISFTLNTYFAHQHQPVSTLHSIQHNPMHFKRVNAQNSLAKDKILLVLSCYGSKEVTQGFSAVIKTNCRKSVFEPQSSSCPSQYGRSAPYPVEKLLRICGQDCCALSTHQLETCFTALCTANLCIQNSQIISSTVPKE